MATKKDVASPSEYRPPQKLLVPCAACGATVLRGHSRDGKITAYLQPLTPVLGEPHVCAPKQEESHA